MVEIITVVGSRSFMISEKPSRISGLLTIISERTLLPERGKSIISKQSMYCSDPRDGKAIFIFKRPQMVGKAGAADPRTTYSPHLVVEINPDFPPLEERIELTVTIDDNLIVHVLALAMANDKAIEVEYYDFNWKKQRQKLSGWTAQICQHEIDHLSGKII